MEMCIDYKRKFTICEKVNIYYNPMSFSQLDGSNIFGDISKMVCL